MFEKSFPSALKAEVQAAEAVVFKNENALRYPAYFDENQKYYLFDGECIRLPYRIYGEEADFGALSGNAKIVAHCLLSRSSNGYIRQKHVAELIKTDFPDWVAPYILELAGEYVLAIVEEIYNGLKDKDCGPIRAVICANNARFVYLHAKMITYWALHYRRQYPRFKSYVGRILFRDCFGYTRYMEKRTCPRIVK